MTPVGREGATVASLKDSGDSNRADAGARVKKQRRRARNPKGEPGPKKLARRQMRQQGPTGHEGQPEAGKKPRVADGAAHHLRAIEPPVRSLRRTVGEVWRYRVTYFYFLRRNIQRRYGRTFLGYLWLFLPIIAPLLLGSLVFGGILGVSVGDLPYFMFFIVTSAAWHTFSTTALFATRSLEITRSELRRVYVPRLIPLSAAMALPGFGLLIYLAILAGAVVFYVLTRGEFYLVFSPVTLLAPVALASLVVFALACGLWFSPLAARARDVRRLAGYVLGFWYFLTPIIYPIEEIPSNWQWLASLNPITAPVETFKIGLIGVGEVTVTGVVSFFAALLWVGLLGLLQFTAKERSAISRYY